MQISSIHSREILDSRGNPTVETTVVLENGTRGVASVPSGASTGVHEAWELRDEDKDRYLGKGVLKVVNAIEEEMAPEIVGMDCREQAAIDKRMIEMDGTPNKKKFGSNGILSISLAVAKAAAQAESKELFEYLRNLFNGEKEYLMPVPMFNIFNGGAHADTNLDIQEFMLVADGTENFREAVRLGSETYHKLKEVLKNNKLDTDVGDEGGFAPDVRDLDQPFEFIQEAVKMTGRKLGIDCRMAIDVGAVTLFRKGGLYHLGAIGRDVTADELTDMYKDWHERFSLVAVEDGLGEDEWDEWTKMNSKIGDEIQLIGDDLLVTNTKRLQRAIDEKAANAILIKLNQIGTLTETMEAIRLAKENGFGTVISHRSGETTDTFISDLAVATNVGQIKMGSLSRGERIAKYNRLMQIEDILGDRAKFKSPFK